MVKSRGIYIIVFFFLLTSYFFNYVYLDPRQLSMVSRICVAFLFIYLIFNWGIISKKKKTYSSYPYVLYFLLAPFLTHISCYVSHSQSIISSISVSASALVISIYFFCILKEVNKKKIIEIIIVLAILRTIITLIEQFTYPSVLFSSVIEQFDEYGQFHEIDTRSGIHRFVLSHAHYLPVFLGFYSFVQFINKKRRILNATLFIVACLGLYLDQTRQVIFIFIICLLFTPFLINNKKSNSFLRGTVVVLLLLAVLYFNYDSLFGELTSKTSDQLNADYTRSVEMSFFLSRMGGILTVLFGNGWFGTSSYGQEYISLQTISKMYRCDVGVVGAAHMLGIIFTIVFIFFIIRLLWKYRKILPMEYKFLYLFILFDLPLIFPLYNYTYNCVECFMGLLFYITDKSIQEYKGMYLASKKQ